RRPTGPLCAASLTPAPSQRLATGELFLHSARLPLTRMAGGALQKLSRLGSLLRSSAAIACPMNPNIVRLDPYEEDRFSLVRALDALPAIADSFGSRRAAAIHRSGCRRGGAGRGRGLFPRSPFRPPARFALPAAGGRGRQ